MGKYSEEVRILLEPVKKGRELVVGDAHTARDRFEILKSAGEFGGKICALTRKSAAFSLVVVIFSRIKGKSRRMKRKYRFTHLVRSLSWRIFWTKLSIRCFSV
jgi:hypothetical protein